jgi:hypothetical protein
MARHGPSHDEGELPAILSDLTLEIRDPGVARAQGRSRTIERAERREEVIAAVRERLFTRAFPGLVFLRSECERLLAHLVGDARPLQVLTRCVLINLGAL